MHCKDKDDHSFRIIAPKEMETIPGSKNKDKARKELWDSLCEVYEKEAEKVNEEVDMNKLEEWSIINPETSLRRQIQLAVTNPQLMSAAAPSFPDNADLLLELNPEDEQEGYEKLVNERKNKRRGLEPTKKCRCRSSYFNSSLQTTPIKKRNKPTSMSGKKTLSVSLMRKRVEDKILKSLKKQQKQKINDKSPCINRRNAKKICVGKKKSKQKLVNLEISTESKNNQQACKNSISKEEVEPKSNEIIKPSHNCDLEYRYYLNTQNVCTRRDGRVFNCKLIFKVCNCIESDIVF